MNKAKDYIQLHLNILLFSLTSVFSKAASVQLNRGGIKNPLLYVFLFLMVANCGIYAIAWQKVIKKFSLSTAYANRSVYLIFGSVLLLNTYAYTQVDLKYGPVLDTFTYVFVLLLSFGVLKEKVSKGKLIGNLIIILGVLVYTLP